MRLQELRGTYGIQAPAPICLDPDVPGQSAQVVVAAPGTDDATCQTVQAPAGTGSRLVPDLIDAHRRASGEGRQAAGDETEIRLTYRELSALIEDAIRNLGNTRGKGTDALYKETQWVRRSGWSKRKASSR
jgi:hypothetical protein